MLRWISIFGGLLIMMGHHARSEALFYYFRLEDQIPENHLLRLIDKHISFEFVRQQLKDSYSDTGRPSIDPELLLRMLLIGYLYGITSGEEALCVRTQSLSLLRSASPESRGRGHRMQSRVLCRACCYRGNVEGARVGGAANTNFRIGDDKANHALKTTSKRRWNQ
jgi:Transposase domain (DUF772)